ncbi:MAG: hypothetical protein M3Q56_05690 [Bacteroidota bacterium]|nr:hypothetical protein [Bacteroidota bacterium]
MKRNIVWVLFALLVLGSCSEDFQLTEEWKDIPVVYGFLNRTDTAQYIRVEKVFVSEDIPATQIALIPDSLYYKNVIVKLFNKTVNKEYTLQKVDANLEGYPRAAGPFATAPNYLYKILTKDMILRGGDSIILSIDRGDLKPIIYARISMIKDVKFFIPDTTTRQLNINPTRSQSFSWSDNGGNAKIFDLDMTINIEETDLNTNKVMLKKIETNLLKSDFGTSVLYKGESFFTLLKNSLEVAPNLERRIKSIVLELKAGGIELKENTLIINANTGITASQEIPRFSNISEGFGLFSSIHTARRSLTIDIETLGFLQTNDLTRQLNFKL